jgi:hypothetical protein
MNDGGRGNKKGLSLNDKPFNPPPPQPVTPPDSPPATKTDRQTGAGLRFFAGPILCDIRGVFDDPEAIQ